MKVYYTLFVSLLLFSIAKAEKTKVNFESEDGLSITADLYLSHDLNAPFIVLFHQAGWSRGEYLEIAPKLNGLGFNCMAVDLRSGGKVNEVSNETNGKAIRGMKGTTYIDSYPDMRAALAFARKNYAKQQLIIWGSSYSSALALVLAGETKVEGVLAFSPGEYFTRFGKTKTFVRNGAKTISCPAFITSTRDEKSNWWPIYESIGTEQKYYFVPETLGNHGSRALWEKFSDSKYYWSAVEDFLNRYLEQTEETKE